MKTERISSAGARAILGVEVKYFRESDDLKVEIRQGQYYRIIGDSPDSGVAISDGPQEGFVQAEYRCRIGKVKGMEYSATCIFPDWRV